jgi:hypothetical protein
MKKIDDKKNGLKNKNTQLYQDLALEIVGLNPSKFSYLLDIKNEINRKKSVNRDPLVLDDLTMQALIFIKQSEFAGRHGVIKASASFE